MLVYTDLAERIIRDVVHHVRDLGHIDPDYLAIVTAARCTGRHTGNLATCCGLRDEPRPTFSIWTRTGSRRIIAVSQWFQSVSPQVRFRGRNMLYLIQLRLPRMLIKNPLETLVHELYHIGLPFDGSMRPARHGEFFDREVRRLTREWLRAAKGELPRLAQMNFQQLLCEHRAVLGLSLPSNFKIPYQEEVRAPENYAAGIARLYPGYRLALRCPVRKIELNATEPMLQLTDKDLVLRHFDQRGTRRIPPMFARHAHGREALSA